MHTIQTLPKKNTNNQLAKRNKEKKKKGEEKNGIITNQECEMYCVSSRHKCLHQDRSDKTSKVLSGKRKIKGKSRIESNQMNKTTNEKTKKNAGCRTR